MRLRQRTRFGLITVVIIIIIIIIIITIVINISNTIVVCDFITIRGNSAPVLAWDE